MGGGVFEKYYKGITNERCKKDKDAVAR